jgi:hypothetical protein
MGAPIKHDFAHLSKTNPKEYNKLYARYLREKRAKTVGVAEHLILERLDKLPEGVQPVPEWPTYYASEDGRIFRDNRETAKQGLGKIIQLKARWNPKVGYYQVQPYMPNGKRKLMYVHRMVLAAFTGEMRSDLYCNHKDFDRANNAYSNLEWVTFNENMAHFAEYGGPKTYPILGEGRNTSNTKYSQYKSQIRDLLEMGHDAKTIAATLDIPVHVIYYTKNSKGYNFY